MIMVNRYDIHFLLNDKISNLLALHFHFILQYSQQTSNFENKVLKSVRIHFVDGLVSKDHQIVKAKNIFF